MASFESLFSLDSSRNQTKREGEEARSQKKGRERRETHRQCLLSSAEVKLGPSLHRGKLGLSVAGLS